MKHKQSGQTLVQIERLLMNAFLGRRGFIWKQRFHSHFHLTEQQPQGGVEILHTDESFLLSLYSIYMFIIIICFTQTDFYSVRFNESKG